MQVDSDLQLWMDVQAGNGQTIVAPYVLAARERELQFELRLVNNGPSGTSSVAQGGNVHVNAGTPTRLSNISVTPQPGGTCKLALVLRENGKEVGRYTLDCGAKSGSR